MIQINLDLVMAQKRISAGRLAELIDLTPANLSILKNNRAKAVRFSTLNALCRELECQPGDILEYIPDKEEEGRQGKNFTRTDRRARLSA